MLASEFLTALEAHICFKVAAPTPDRFSRERVIELSTDKVLLVTHFKALARLGEYHYKRKVFIMRMRMPTTISSYDHRKTVDLCRVYDDEAEKILSVVAKAAASRETTREKLAERKAMQRAKPRERTATEHNRDELELYAEDVVGYVSPESLAMARERLGFAPDPVTDRRWSSGFR